MWVDYMRHPTGTQIAVLVFELLGDNWRVNIRYPEEE